MTLVQVWEEVIEALYEYSASIKQLNGMVAKLVGDGPPKLSLCSLWCEPLRPRLGLEMCCNRL